MKPKPCKLFHEWSGWVNYGGGRLDEFRQCDKCGKVQARTRK